jgi:cytochrome oxidase Cu insertion factor (SCO1/SenC/PrrC family)
MKKLSLIALLILVTAAGVLKSAASEEKALDELAPPRTFSQRTEPVAIGDTAPDFTLEDQNGTKFTLSDSRSKSPVVLVFYRASW